MSINLKDCKVSMANTASTMPGIKRSWSLLSFRAEHGKMQLGEFRNKETGETFKSTIFTNETTGDKVFVHFSSNLGPLTAQQIKDQKSELQVVELESGNYCLCKQGTGAWEDVL